MKNLAFRLFVLSVAILFTWGMQACKSPSEKTSEEAAEKAMELATGKNIEIDKKGGDVTIEGGGERIVMSETEREWPSAIPGYIPKLEGLKIVRVTESTMNEAHTWNVMYEGATVDKIDEYNAALKAAGFETTSFKTPQGGNVSGQRGNMLVSCIVSEKTCMVSVQERKNE